VRRFIQEELGWTGADALTDDYPLVVSGVLDSIGIVHVTAFLEGEFGVHLFDQDVDPRHFGSIESIARLVETGLATRGTPEHPDVERADVAPPGGSE
jgi:acyl carrier protein